MRGALAAFAALVLALAAPPASRAAGGAASPPAPLVIGETFTIDSAVLGETRRINVYAPPAYADSAARRFPVLVMPDGGMGEDFLHVAGLVQVSCGNGTMRPMLLVGIENTERRRDLTGPTNQPQDRRIAKHVGGSEAFRRFLRSELLPVIDARYRTSGERAIMGESLAGLFVVETLFREPDLFDTYVAFDPSLWWNDSTLAAGPPPGWSAAGPRPKRLYLAASRQPDLARLTQQLAETLRRRAIPNLAVEFTPLPDETHGTIYHPAALAAVRKLFAP